MAALRAILAVLLLAPLAASGQDVGRVLVAVGDVTVERGGRGAPVASGGALRTGDVVSTGEASAAQLRFDDASVVAMRAKSRFRVVSFVFTGRDDGVSQAAFELLRGGIRTLTGLIGRDRPDRYRMRTPLASVGIRGTAYALLHCEGDCEDDDAAAAPDGTYGVVHEGRVAVANAAGEVEFGRDETFFVADARTLPQRLAGRPGFLRDRLEARARREQRREAIERGREAIEARIQAAAEQRDALVRATVAAFEARTGGEGRPVGSLGTAAAPIIAVTDQRDAGGNVALLGPGLGAGVGFATAQVPLAIVDGGAGTLITLDAGRGFLERFVFNGGAQSGERRGARVADSGRLEGDGGAVWGRWSYGAPVEMGGLQAVPGTGVHFLFGNLAPESLLATAPAAATALRYDYAGGPRPTNGEGDAGAMLAGTFVVNLVNRSIAGGLAYQVGDIRYELPVPQGTPLVAGRGFIGFNVNARDAGSWVCACSGTAGTLDAYSLAGLFLGSRAQGLGVTFGTQDSSAGRTAGAGIFRCVSGGCR